MKLYRVMSECEFDNTSDHSPFSWNSKFKWFTHNLNFILSRVTDGKFNNSQFKKGRYTHLIEYVVADVKGVIKQVSNNEFMLARKDAPNIKVFSISKVGRIYDEFD